MEAQNEKETLLSKISQLEKMVNDEIDLFMYVNILTLTFSFFTAKVQVNLMNSKKLWKK